MGRTRVAVNDGSAWVRKPAQRPARCGDQTLERKSRTYPIGFGAVQRPESPESRACLGATGAV
jgi:hypothetical protein